MKLKSHLLLLLIGILSFSFPAILDAETPLQTPDEIEIEGEWNDVDIRSIGSSRPVVFLNGNSIYLSFPKTISNLSVKIIDSYGDVVYEEMVSAIANTVYFIPNSLNTGNYTLNIGIYTLMLNHSYGLLIGEFTIH